MSLVRMAFEKVFQATSNYYKKLVAKELSFYGTRHEDLFNEHDPDVKEAIELSSPEVRLGRYRRLKRAYDLNVKNKYFMDYATPEQMNYDPYVQELWPLIQRIRSRNQQIAELNAYKWR